MPLTRQAAIALRRGPARVGKLRRLADQGDPQAGRQLAVWLAASGDRAELATRMAGGDRYARRQLSDLAARDGRYDEAIALLQPLAAHHGARRRLVKLLGAAGRIDEAVALTRDPPPEWAHDTWLMSWLMSQGQVAEMLRLAAAGDEFADYMLADVAAKWWAAGRIEDAIGVLRTLRITADRSSVLRNTARMHWRTGRLPLRDRAIDALAGIEHPLCRRTRARLLQLQGRHAEAEAELRALAAQGDPGADGALADLAAWQPRPRELHVLRHAPGGHLRSVTYHPDGALVAGADGTVLMWPDRGARPQRFAPGHGHATLSRDGALLAATGAGHTRVWRLPGGAPVREFRGGAASRAVAISPDGRLLATDRLWELDTGADLGPVGAGEVRSAAFSPDGTLLAVAADRSVWLWAVAGRRRLWMLDTRAYAVAFHPAGHLLAIADDHAVRLWDPVRGTLAGRLDVGARAIAYSPDGELIAAVRNIPWPAGVRLWRPRTDDVVWSCPPPADGVAFSPDGTELAVVVAADAVVRCWDVAALGG